MALEIKFTTGRSLDIHTPIGENTRTMIRGNVANGTIAAIIADGHEGVACINAYRRMQGEPPMEAEAIGYQVCYAGDIAASVLLNLVYNP